MSMCTMSQHQPPTPCRSRCGRRWERLWKQGAPNRLQWFWHWQGTGTPHTTPGVNATQDPVQPRTWHSSSFSAHGKGPGWLPPKWRISLPGCPCQDNLRPIWITSLFSPPPFPSQTTSASPSVTLALTTSLSWLPSRRNAWGNTPRWNPAPTSTSPASEPRTTRTTCLGWQLWSSSGGCSQQLPLAMPPSPWTMQPTLRDSCRKPHRPMLQKQDGRQLPAAGSPDLYQDIVPSSDSLILFCSPAPDAHCT
jgi:hypothetical protein